MGGLDGMRISPLLPFDLERLELLFPALGPYYRERARQPGLVLVARVGTRPVGAMHVSLRPAHEPEVIRRLGPVPMLHKLMVAEPVRGRRVGTRLIGAAEAALRSRGERRVAVGVDVGNAGAARLYRRLTYREWAHGPLDTVRERVEGGKTIVEPDQCLLFVKYL
ncbi:GNAT family N-acetyltransferase [Couchioplanes caeruleus]|uniref:GNAT family N-acetyltransferase n=1 Tax=Couchioplanes caeruleus TaxID=56438 RepID=UPI0020C0D49A|nr:GNAT family N-acetyltransferase [Couchioplanes caeruleus]UQU65654.1 GNAT family N-acetyltransferase [Couchioplanes caeruleus]